MNTWLSIVWAVDPQILELGPIRLRWYGLLFATGFLLGYLITQRVFKREQKPEAWLDSLLLTMVLATLVGARLGHVFFYEWEVYSQQPWRIPFIWEGGLASHGAAIGLFIALAIWSRRVSKLSAFWVMDRLAMSVALGGAFIRLGNLMNHEIVGKPADLPWAFRFMRYAEVMHVPRHPAQLYEALAYLLIAGLLALLYWGTQARLREGLLTGLFLVLIFTARLLLEFTKIPQENISDPTLTRWLEILNMGQWLSLPLIVAGLGCVFRALSRPPAPDPMPVSSEHEKN
ncbi:MAG: prolipoprotein diacylglyceryl transferase [Bacteroidia bacterium]|nr:prolipoprotein diacylglyceryl transferase [Bacteroidia bacterium]